MRRDPTRLALSLLTSLAACSGESEPPIAVHFTPAALAASFDDGANVGMLHVDATLSRSPCGPAWVLVQQPEPVLDLSQTTVWVSGDGMSASLGFRPSCALAPAFYSGAITLALCRDAQCGSTYPPSGNTLPYAFTVSAGLVVTAAVDGVAQLGYTTIRGVGGLGGAGATFMEDLSITRGDHLDPDDLVGRRRGHRVGGPERALRLPGSERDAGGRPVRLRHRHRVGREP